MLASLLAYLISFYYIIKGTPAWLAPVENSKYEAKEIADVDEKELLQVVEDQYSEDESGQKQVANGQRQKAQVVAPTTIDYTMAVDRNDPQIFKSLITGLPSSSSFFWSLVTVGTNLMVALMVADLTLRGPIFHQSQELSFARVGYVSDTTASLLLREPDPSHLPLFITYKQQSIDGVADSSSGLWTLSDKIYWLSNDTDFTYALQIRKLRPSTYYQYSTSNGHSGNFRTAATVGKFHPDTDKFTFLTTSCIKPRFPYNPLSHPLAIPGLSHLASIIPSLKASFILFLGDFVYIDVPRRFGWQVEDYRAEYRRVYASPSWSPVSKSLPWIHVIDDHEIANDWDKGLSAPYPAAIDPFTHYHHSVNPPLYAANASYYAFAQGPTSFFLLDTRRYRSPSSDLPPTRPDKSMLGKHQLDAVLSWLARPEPEGVHWKILVSSIPFTRNWRVNTLDTWAGYLAERQVILEAMWDAASHPSGMGVVVLSGDRHEFAATSFPAPPGSGRWAREVRVHEFSCSPLSMFYLPVRTYREVEGEQSGVGLGGEDRCLAYLPDGNSKIGAVEIENAVGGGQSSLRYRLYIDGEERWSHVVTTTEARGGEMGAVWG